MNHHKVSTGAKCNPARFREPSGGAAKASPSLRARRASPAEPFAGAFRTNLFESAPAVKAGGRGGPGRVTLCFPLLVAHHWVIATEIVPLAAPSGHTFAEARDHHPTHCQKSLFCRIVLVSNSPVGQIPMPPGKTHIRSPMPFYCPRTVKQGSVNFATT